ncbi:DUF6580 family putative transport protein [Chloroflexota bacterium]
MKQFLVGEEKRKKLLFALALLGIGIIGRILLTPYPNIETVLVVTMLAGCLLGGMYILIIPVLVMAATDFFIGTNSILLFTWSGFAFIGVLGYLLKNKRKASMKFVGTLFGVGLGATLLYDIWTASGWWYLMHPHTLDSLGLVYLLQIPFTLKHLISTAIFVPLVSIPILYLYEYGWGKLYSLSPIARLSHQYR